MCISMVALWMNLALDDATNCIIQSSRKQSNCGHALEHLQSSGTTIVRNGQIVCKLCQEEKRDRHIS